MTNPIMSLLQAQAPVQNPLAGIFNILKATNNPIAMLQSMAMSDPRVKTAFDLIQQNGGNARQAFYAEAQRQGVDPAEKLRQFQSMMK